VPPPITRFIWPLLAFKTSLSFSNLPGPQWKFVLDTPPTKTGSNAGVPIQSLFFFVPPQNTIGLMVTISSYDGRVMFSASNDGRMSSPAEMDRLGELFAEELKALVQLARGSIGGREFENE
jgi:hypothetical protein